VCCKNSVFFLLWCVCFLHVASYVLYVWCAFCMCDCDSCVVVFDRLGVWLAVRVMRVVCDVRTVCGHAWSVSLTMCVVFSLRTVLQVYCVQLRSQCVWGLMFSVLCCPGVERLLHSSTLEIASHACPFSPQVRKPLGVGVGSCFLRAIEEDAKSRLVPLIAML